MMPQFISRPTRALHLLLLLSCLLPAVARAGMQECAIAAHEMDAMSSNPALCNNPNLIDGVINRAQAACQGMDDGINYNDLRRQARAEIAQSCAKLNGGKALSGTSGTGGKDNPSGSTGLAGSNVNGAGVDPSLFDGSGDDPDSTYRKLAAAGTTFQRPDPAADQTGRECVYFTRPLVRPDGGGLNSYAEDAYVVYGRWMYRCLNQHWMRIGPADAFANSADYNAERQERSTINISGN